MTFEEDIKIKRYNLKLLLSSSRSLVVELLRSPGLENCSIVNVLHEEDIPVSAFVVKRDGKTILDIGTHSLNGTRYLYLTTYLDQPYQPVYYYSFDTVGEKKWLKMGMLLFGWECGSPLLSQYPSVSF